ncbi:hypothetical protein, partial [Brevibacillus borstelensis]|uniref:hypothetical protein n=1 Tax=Brevibacillus borstelensis TaxID=45462 RepID=UPI003D1C6ACF
RKNAARLLKENGLHFSLKSFFVKNSVGYPIRKPQKRYFAGLSFGGGFFLLFYSNHCNNYLFKFIIKKY